MIYNGTIFGLDFKINPVAFTIPIGGGWDVYWYGIIIACGFLAAIGYGFFMAKKMGVDVDRMIDVILVTTPIAILCARAYYVIFDDEKITSIGDFFGFSGSSGFAGLAIYGGVIGAFACGFLMCKIKKLNVLDMFDLAATGFILAQGIGRWGNFFNQEAYGTFTGSSWWGMTSNRIASEMGGTGLVHPCFLYESIWCILGFFVLHFVIKNRKFRGQAVLTYCVLYGFERGFLELIRTDSLMLGNIRVSSLLSFLLCIGSAVAIAAIFGSIKNKSAQADYQPLFKEQMDSSDIIEELPENSEGKDNKND